MVLQPEALIDGIVSNVIVMKGEEFNKEAAVLKARRGESSAVSEGNTD
jgi:hypothetical protein